MSKKPARGKVRIVPIEYDHPNLRRLARALIELAFEQDELAKPTALPANPRDDDKEDRRAA